MLSGSELALAGLAAVAAGLINALAGGGTLVSFPTLIAMGIPPVVANITNTVALCPGYLGGALAQRADLRGQGRRLLILVPAAIIGGVAGGILLLAISAQIFQPARPLPDPDGCRAARGTGPGEGMDYCTCRPRPVGRFRRSGCCRVQEGGPAGRPRSSLWRVFGPGLSVIVLAVLGLFIDDNLTRLNALKQCISLAVNIAAAIFFIFTGLVIWPLALVMAAGALIGGAAGGTIAGRIGPARLQWAIVAIGIVVGMSS